MGWSREHLASLYIDRTLGRSVECFLSSTVSDRRGLWTRFYCRQSFELGAVNAWARQMMQYLPGQWIERDNSAQTDGNPRRVVVALDDDIAL